MASLRRRAARGPSRVVRSAAAICAGLQVATQASNCHLRPRSLTWPVLAPHPSPSIATGSRAPTSGRYGTRPTCRGWWRRANSGRSSRTFARSLVRRRHHSVRARLRGRRRYRLRALEQRPGARWWPACWRCEQTWLRWLPWISNSIAATEVRPFRVRMDSVHRRLGACQLHHPFDRTDRGFGLVQLHVVTAVFGEQVLAIG